MTTRGTRARREKQAANVRGRLTRAHAPPRRKQYERQAIREPLEVGCGSFLLQCAHWLRSLTSPGYGRGARAQDGADTARYQCEENGNANQ